MKSTDNQDMLEYAEEATAKVAEALVKSSKASGAKKSVRFNEEANTIHEFDREEQIESSKTSKTKKSVSFNEEANTIHEIFDALESNDPVKNLEKLDQKNVEKKEHSSISTKIKDFVKSVIKFLKSPFTKQSKAELDKTTEETVEQIGKSDRTQSQYQDNTLKVNQHRSSEVETQVNPNTRRAPPPPPERTPMQATQAENQQRRPAPPPPPERKSAQTAHAEQAASQRPSTPPPPPPPPPMSNTFQSAGAPQAHLDAIKQGVTLKSVAKRELGEVKNPQDQQPDHIGELEKRLKSRREKSGQERSVTPSNKFAEDAKQFEAARKEELERQAKAEKSENEKVAKATAEEAAKKAETQPKPVALNLKPGEIPMAPPPPPPGLQTNKPFAKADPAPAQKNQQQNKGPQQFGVDQKDIQDIRATLKKATQEPETKKGEAQAQTDFRAVLNKKDKPQER